MMENLSTKEYLDRYVVKADQCSDDYQQHCRTAWHGMRPSIREALGQLVIKGPVWDGDVVSKTARDELLYYGLASRACVKGEQGFTVANYSGWDVYKAGTSL
jgi:hypothetical protein